VLLEGQDLCVLSSVCFGFRLVNSARRVLWRSIHCEQLEVAYASIDEVMLRSRWHKAKAVCSNRMILIIQDGLTLTSDEDEHLISIMVRFLTDLTTWRDTHEHYLTIRTGHYLLTEVLVFLCEREDIAIEYHCCMDAFL